MRQVWIATFAVVLPLLGACSNGPPPHAAAAVEDPGLYVIGAGDQLSIFVYGAPQLSGTIPVRPDGHLSSPLISDLVAAGKTPPQLAQDITSQLKQYILDPTVTVIVQNFVGPFDRQIRVIGEAAEPQAIAFRQHMTVLDLMIQTKGLTRFASGNRSILVRRVDGHEQDIPVRLADLIKDGDIRQNVELQPGDTLIIPQSWF
jgi:polysaccharide export outer membrane protein